MQQKRSSYNYTSYSLNFLGGCYTGDYVGDYYRGK